MSKLFRYSIGIALASVMAVALAGVGWVIRSLPVLDGAKVLPGLMHEVRIESDRLAVPRVIAQTRLDAYRALGFLHARDRLFQMDLARRKSAGELAELFGEKALALDKKQRVYQARRSAQAIAASLPPEQRAILAAYADGVNSLLASADGWSLETKALGYEPALWRPEDSLLVAFGMFQTLTTQEQDERMLSVMDRVLPAEIVAFLTPDADSFSAPLAGGSGSRRPAREVPLKAFDALIAENRSPVPRVSVEADERFAGSNQWAVSGRKTLDGRAMVANDMHLTLGLPNTWYRAELRYGDATLTGVTLPGLPMVVAGSNGAIAWGFTNVDADVMDLVRLELDPARPDVYRTEAGTALFERTTETIRVKDAPPVRLELRNTIWGPVLPDPLLGSTLALRWTALDPSFVNLRLLDIDRADTLERAVAVFNRSGIPPQNVVMADTDGHIAWTYAGVFPKRQGFDGAVSESWAEGTKRWDGTVPAEDLPRLIDPVDGYIATANNRTLGRDYPYVIGHNYAHSYRAHRISHRLAEMPRVSEGDMLALQLDTVSRFFEFYRQLIRELADDRHSARDVDLAEARRAVEAWDGRMDSESRGIALLVRFRQRLAQSVFAPWIQRCIDADPQFTYAWREMETPLRALLQQRSRRTLPDPGFHSWEEFLRAELLVAVRGLRTDYPDTRLEDLVWRQVNVVHVRHPFGRLMSWLSPVLDIPAAGFAGCSGYCVRILSGDLGASERFVVSPGHHADGLFHMPGGQSGHPFSSHYRDQHRAWAEGWPLPFEISAVEHTLTLSPQ